jgi:hypothetical protein
LTPLRDIEVIGDMILARLPFASAIARGALFGVGANGAGTARAHHPKAKVDEHALLGFDPSRFLVIFITFLALAGPVDARPPFGGWDLETDVDSPTYAMAEPTSTDLNIDMLVLSCEQGPDRRGLQLRLHLSGSGPLAPGMPGRLKDQPRLEIAIDGISHRAELLFADDFVVVADSADGAMPLLSDRLVDALQRGRRMELRFDLLQEPTGLAPDFDGTVMVELQVGRGGSAVATLRRCAADGRNQHLGETN